jgi:hypothetical protein
MEMTMATNAVTPTRVPMSPAPNSALPAYAAAPLSFRTASARAALDLASAWRGAPAVGTRVPTAGAAAAIAVSTMDAMKHRVVNQASPPRGSSG